MIVDTNFLLRILEQDEGAHGTAARARVRAAREEGLSLTVLAATTLEVAFVLESKRAGYGWTRDGIADAVGAIVDEPAFSAEHREALMFAAATYRNSAVDLHDAYLDAVARERGARVLSFDADLHRLGTGEAP